MISEAEEEIEPSEKTTDNKKQRKKDMRHKQLNGSIEDSFTNNSFKQLDSFNASNVNKRTMQ